jgi:hypothetical protein
VRSSEYCQDIQRLLRVWHNHIDCIAGMVHPQSQRLQIGMDDARINMDNERLTPDVMCGYAMPGQRDGGRPAGEVL